MFHLFSTFGPRSQTDKTFGRAFVENILLNCEQAHPCSTPVKWVFIFSKLPSCILHTIKFNTRRKLIASPEGRSKTCCEELFKLVSDLYSHCCDCQVMELSDLHNPTCKLHASQSFEDHSPVRERRHSDTVSDIFLSPEAYKATQAVEFIAEHLRNEDEYVQVNTIGNLCG